MIIYRKKTNVPRPLMWISGGRAGCKKEEGNEKNQNQKKIRNDGEKNWMICLFIRFDIIHERDG